MMRLFVLFLVLSVVLQGCLSLEGWPGNIPDRNSFEAAYHDDPENHPLQTEEEYLTWVRRFYEGYGPMSMGWNEMTTVVLDGLEGNSYQQVAILREYLGQLIAAEWAKDNSVRNIDSAMLSLWGAVMVSVSGAEQKIEALDLLISDATDLINGDLFPDQINDPRYEDRLGISLEP